MPQTGSDPNKNLCPPILLFVNGFLCNFVYNFKLKKYVLHAKVNPKKLGGLYRTHK